MPASLELLAILMRWTHIACVVLTIGGIAYARLIAFPAAASLPSAERTPLLGEMLRRYRPMLCATLAGILVSGLYNLLSRRGHTPYYHAWFGIKMLLVAHIIAASLLLVRALHNPDEEPRRLRQMSGVVISGLIVILISAYLRRIY